jgi:hypothetical protein
LLADQQKKHSGSYQQGKQSTDDERSNRVPTRLDRFRSSAFLRCSYTQPEEKFVHRSERHHRRCFESRLRRRLPTSGEIYQQLGDSDFVILLNINSAATAQ